MKTRIAISALTLSFAGWLTYVAIPEHFVAVATIPTKNDRCTNGFGSTFKEDGTPVKCGEVIAPVQAIQRSMVHIAKSESKLKRCIKGDLHQVEFDLLTDHSYQYGEGATCSSPMVANVNKGNYTAACKGYLEYKYVTSPNQTKGWTAFKWDAAGKPIRWRFDCSTAGNRICAGVWTRSLERHDKCMAAQ